MKPLLALLLFAFFPAANLPSVIGIKLNDPKSVLSTIKLKKVAEDHDMHKYRADNGNDLSITIEDGKVVYIEEDWQKGTRPLLTDFKFGTTTLDDIRSRFGSNGFAYKKNVYVPTATDLIEFNCYDIDAANNQVLVVITKVPKDKSLTLETIGAHTKLVAIILAKKQYLDEIWGDEKIYDPNNKSIQL